MFSSSIWRTVSAQPLPSNIIRLRNILFFDGWLILAVDLFNAYLHSVQPRLQGNVGVERDWLVLVLAASVTLNLHYANLKSELDRRERELNLKEDQHLFVQEANLLTAQPCGHLLTDGDLSGVVNRLRHPHDVDLRANILCPKC